MRAIKISIIAFLLIIAPVILESCCWHNSCGCGGPDFKQPHFDINDMSLTVTPFPYNTPPPVPSPATFSNIALQVKLEVSYTYANLGGSFGSALFACEPPPPISSQLITDVLITSNNTLETTTGDAPSGSNLNFLFGVNSIYSSEDPIEVALINREYLPEYISFRSKAVLSNQQTHTFTIVFTLDDGRVFTLVTSPLELI